MYRLLARLWLREVDRELLLALRTPPVRESFSDVGGVLPDDTNDRVLEELASDFCQLFIGPRDHLPPVQSVWQNGQFQGEPARSMSEFLEVIRYDRSSLPDGQMLDHLGVQLNVMADIINPARSAPNAEIVEEVAGAFFTAHLQWPWELLEAASGQAATSFYQSVIDLTRGFLATERESLV